MVKEESGKWDPMKILNAFSAKDMEKVSDNYDHIEKKSDSAYVRYEVTDAYDHGMEKVFDIAYSVEAEDNIVNKMIIDIVCHNENEYSFAFDHAQEWEDLSDNYETDFVATLTKAYLDEDEMANVFGVKDKDKVI